MITSTTARRRLSIGATILIVAGIAVWASMGGFNHGASGDHLATVQIAPRADASNATTSTVPSSLPPGATVSKTLSAASPPLPQGVPASSVTGTGGATTLISLSGAANQNTTPAGGVTAVTAATTHPATDIQIDFVPGVTSLPEIPAGPPYFTSSQVTVAGNPATLTVPANTYGTYRLDWLDADGYHVVLCDRLTTADGASGVPTEELMRIADSLYT